jgi:hypothetical protein
MNISLAQSCLLASAAALLLTSSPAHAISLTNFIYEGFNYTTTDNPSDNTSDGDIGANTGGTGWGATPSAWTDAASTTVNVISPGLLYAGLPTTGNALNLNAVPTNTTQSFFRLLNQSGAIDTGTFYFSFLVRKDVDSPRTINVSLFSANAERLTFGQFSPTATSTNGNIGITQLNAAPGIVGATPIPFNLGTTYLLVARVDFNVSGALDRVRLFVNPALNGLEPATPYIDVTTVDIVSVDQVRPFVGNASTAPVAAASNATFDEFRFGPTYSAVTVPEPTAAALLALAGGMLTARRRRS